MAKEKKEKKEKVSKKQKKEKDLIKLNADSEIIKTNDEEIAKEKKKEKIKETKENIKTSFNYYKFVVKIVAAILLITFGIIILVNQNEAVFPIMFAIGGVSVLVAIIRFIANLIKKDLTPKQKLVINVVSAIHLILGVYLIIASFVYNNGLKKGLTGFDNWNAEYYPLLLAIILYVESIGYLMNAILNKLESGKFMFWLHIVYITLSVAAAASISAGFNGKKLIIVLAVIIFVCALLVGGEAVGGYFNYRNGKNPTKSKDKEKDKENNEVIEAPTTDENKDIIIPTEDNDSDNAIIN